MEAIVKDRQTLLDMAVQTLGGVEGVFALAERNGLSITARLDDGEALAWENSDTVSLKVQTQYAQCGLTPATEISTADMNELLYATGTPRPCILPPRRWTGTTIGEDAAPLDKIWEIIDTLDKGDSVKKTSKIELTRIFADPFDSVFS